MRALLALFAFGLAVVQAQAAITISTSSPAPLEFVQGKAGSPWLGISATGGTAAPLQSVCYTWTVTGFNIPGLVALPGTPCVGGIIVQGTPTTLGTYSFSVSVVDGQGGNASQQISVTVVPPLAIVTQTLPDILSGVPYSAQVVVQGGLKPYQQFQCNVGHFSLSCNQGLVTGTINSSFDTTISCGVDVRVTDRTFTVVQRCFDLHIKAAQPPTNVLKITTNALPAAVIGKPYSFQATAINVTGPPKWSAIGLPAGLMISLSGLISGTPTGPVGVTMVKLGVGDNTALTDSVTIAMAVQAAPTTPPTDPPTDPPGNPSPGDPNQKVVLTTPTLLDPLVLGKFITSKFTATNGVPPYKFTTSILTLPTGMTLNMDGTYIGAPTKAGSYQFQVTVTDSRGDTDTKTYTQTAFDAPRITNTFPNGEVGKPYDVQLQITGGSSPYRVQATGLPPDLSFSPQTLRVTGNTTTGGTFISLFMITDANDTKVTESVSITVDLPPAPLKISSASPLPDITLNLDSTFQFAAAGGKTPYIWSIVGNAIPGLTLDPPTGKLSGKPALAGKQTLNIKVTDATGATDQKAFELTVLTPAQLSANPGQFNITLPPISGVPTTTFGQITNATGSETATVAGVNGAPAALQASILPTGALVVTATTPSNAPATFQNNITIMNTNGQTVVVPVNLTVAKPAKKQFLQLSGRPLSELGSLTFSLSRPDDGFTAESGVTRIYADAPAVSLAVEGRIDGAPEVSSTSYQGTRDGTYPLSVGVFTDVPPGTYTYKGKLQGPGMETLEIPITLIIYGEKPITGTVAQLTRKLGPTLAQDPMEATICSPPGTTVQTNAASTPVPIAGTNCQKLETPAGGDTTLTAESAGSRLKLIFSYGQDSGEWCSVKDDIPLSASLFPATCVNPTSETRGYYWSQPRFRRHFDLGPRQEISDIRTAFGEEPFEFDQSGYGSVISAPASNGSTTGGNPTPQSVLTFVDGKPTPGLNAKSNKSADGCVPKRLFVVPRMATPLFVKIGQGKWLRAAVFDDCGANRSDAQVEVGFSNGDSAVPMTHGLHGRYASFWTPIHEASGTQFLIISASARDLAGLYSVGVTITSDPAAVLLESASVVSGASFEGGRVRAPGEFVSLFGANLAAQTVSAAVVPLPTSLGGVRLELNGVPLPLLFVSTGQINAILPVGVPVNTVLQLALYKGSAPPVLVNLVVAAAQPAVFSRDLTGKGQGIILDPQFRFLDSGNPGKAGDPFVMYLSGLGEVEPAVPSGAAAPTTSLHRVKSPVKVSIGGVEVKNLDFAGLAPGLVGVYQLNGVIPDGVAPGNAVPVVVTAAGQSSPAVTMAIR
ncbi:MAG: putative Ig domain-containing protein [Acidobacteriota bacterium]